MLTSDASLGLAFGILPGSASLPGAAACGLAFGFGGLPWLVRVPASPAAALALAVAARRRESRVQGDHARHT